MRIHGTLRGSGNRGVLRANAHCFPALRQDASLAPPLPHEHDVRSRSPIETQSFFSHRSRTSSLSPSLHSLVVWNPSASPTPQKLQQTTPSFPLEHQTTTSWVVIPAWIMWDSFDYIAKALRDPVGYAALIKAEERGVGKVGEEKKEK